jgi:hypothetical protein
MNRGWPFRVTRPRLTSGSAFSRQPRVMVPVMVSEKV